MRLELQIQSEGDARSAKHDTVVVSRPSVRNVDVPWAYMLIVELVRK